MHLPPALGQKLPSERCELQEQAVTTIPSMWPVLLATGPAPGLAESFVLFSLPLPQGEWQPEAKAALTISLVICESKLSVCKAERNSPQLFAKGWWLLLRAAEPGLILRRAGQSGAALS